MAGKYQVVWFGLALVAAVATACHWSSSAGALPGSVLAGSDGFPSGLISHYQAAGSGSATLTIVDPQLKSVGVYFIDAKTGAIHLKSVRTIRWDLEMNAHNSNDPSPEDIRKGLERQR
jgi:hypothetical protein